MSDMNLRRRASFDEDPEHYARARPGYPEEVFDLILEFAGIGPGARALEIGCGPGQATLPMARRGLRITCIELGPAMARAVLERTHGLDVTVHVGPFEEWNPPTEPFDLVFSGSAFHWIEQDLRCAGTAAALRTGGTLALFWNKHVRLADSDGFGDAVQEVYEREAPRLGRDYRALPSPGELDRTFHEEIVASGLYRDAIVSLVSWNRSFSAAQYVELLDTYSDHRTLDAGSKHRLYAGVHELVETQFGGSVRRDYVTQLHLARRCVR